MGERNRKLLLNANAFYILGTWLCTMLSISLFEPPNNTEYVYCPCVIEEETENLARLYNAPNVILAFGRVCIQRSVCLSLEPQLYDIQSMPSAS